MKKLLTWKKNLVAYLVLLFLLNLFLINLPLANVFGYEFSAINAIAVTLLSGLYSLRFIKTKDSFPQLAGLLRNLLYLLVVPFTVSFINSLLKGFCSFTDGLMFYIIITMPSIIIGAALATVSAALISKFRVIIFILLFLAVALIAALEIYYNPQVYLFNPLFGYFPGTIYDEGLSVSLKLFFYRLLNTLYFLMVLILFYNAIKAKKVGSKILRRLVFAITTAALFYFVISENLGFTTTFAGLKHELPVRLDTEHFTIYADAEIDDNTLKFIAVSQEYFYEKLSVYLQENYNHRIVSFIFASPEQKKKLFGSGNADVAKPWQNCVYVSLENWEISLEHEIAHCFAGNFGWGIFRVAAGFNPALIEGIAEACDGFYDNADIHFLAAAAYQHNFRADISDLFSDFSFFGNVSGLSYIYSGSFVKYLIEHHGIEKVKKYYRTNNFENSFGVNLDEEEKNYILFLSSIKIENRNALANYYFGRQSLIQKVCPRFISGRLESAWEFYYRKDFIEAMSCFNEVLEMSDNFSALIGLSLIYEEMDSVAAAIELLKNNSESFSGSAYEYNLKFRLADLLSLAGEPEKAKGYYKFIAESKPNIRLELLARTRLELLNENMTEYYIKGSDIDKYLLLKKINKTGYSYFSVPLLIELSESLKESYELFLENFEENILVNDFFSAYAVLNLSQYMLKNNDIDNAKKLAALSLRFKDDNLINQMQYENFKKAVWFDDNAENILNGIEISKAVQ